MNFVLWVYTCQLLKQFEQFGVHLQLNEAAVYWGVIVNLVVAIRESYAHCETVQYYGYFGAIYRHCFANSMFGERLNYYNDQFYAS